MGLLLGNRLKDLFTRYATGSDGHHITLLTEQRRGLHEGLRHIEIMHEKRSWGKQWVLKFHPCFQRGNWVIIGGALLILFCVFCFQIQPLDQVHHFGGGRPLNVSRCKLHSNVWNHNVMFLIIVLKKTTTLNNEHCFSPEDGIDQKNPL